MSHSHKEWRQPPPEQLDCEKKLERSLASLVLQGKVTKSTVSYEHVDRDYAARAIVQYLEQAQALGKRFAEQQLATLARSIVVGNPLGSLLDRARDLVDRVLTWAKDLFVSKVEALGEDADEESIEQALEDTAEIVSETQASTEIQGVIEQEVMDELQAAGTTMIEAVNEPDACELCVANAEAGPIPIGSAFPSGDTNTPFHHRCRCHVQGVSP